MTQTRDKEKAARAAAAKFSVVGRGLWLFGPSCCAVDRNGHDPFRDNREVKGKAATRRALRALDFAIASEKRQPLRSTVFCVL